MDFKARKHNDLDVAIKILSELYPCNVPILHIEGNRYLIGDKIKCLAMQGDNVQLRVGGGWEALSTYLIMNAKNIEQHLALHMLKYK